MRRATAKSTERSPATEPGFQCRLGLPSAWSQPETRRTTLVRSHSHTSATSPVPLLPRVPRSLAYLSMLRSRSYGPFSLVCRTVPDSARFFWCSATVRWELEPSAGAYGKLSTALEFDLWFLLGLLLWKSLFFRNSVILSDWRGKHVVTNWTYEKSICNVDD